MQLSLGPASHTDLPPPGRERRHPGPGDFKIIGARKGASNSSNHPPPPGEPVAGSCSPAAGSRPVTLPVWPHPGNYTTHHALRKRELPAPPPRRCACAERHRRPLPPLPSSPRSPAAPAPAPARWAARAAPRPVLCQPGRREAGWGARRRPAPEAEAEPLPLRRPSGTPTVSAGRRGQAGGREGSRGGMFCGPGPRRSP